MVSYLPTVYATVYAEIQNYVFFFTPKKLIMISRAMKLPLSVAVYRNEKPIRVANREGFKITRVSGKYYNFPSSLKQ